MTAWYSASTWPTTHLGAEARLRRGLRARRQPGAGRGIVQQLAQRKREGVHIRHQAAVLPIDDDVGRAAGVQGQDGRAHRAAFEQHPAQDLN